MSSASLGDAGRRPGAQEPAGGPRPDGRRRRDGYFQRVVSAKPAMMNAKPTPRFQAPSGGIGKLLGPAEVEQHDPRQPEEHQPEHRGHEPARVARLGLGHARRALRLGLLARLRLGHEGGLLSWWGPLRRRRDAPRERTPAVVVQEPCMARAKVVDAPRGSVGARIRHDRGRRSSTSVVGAHNRHGHRARATARSRRRRHDRRTAETHRRDGRRPRPPQEGDGP